MGKRRGPTNAAPEVAPLDVDGVRTVAVVTVLWAAAFLVLIFFRERLVDEGRGWWLWTCLAGVGFGLLALEYTRKRRDAILDAERRAGEARDDRDDDLGDDLAAPGIAGLGPDGRSTGPIATTGPLAVPDPMAVAGPAASGPFDRVDDTSDDVTTTQGGGRRAKRGRGGRRRGTGDTVDDVLTTTDPGAPAVTSAADRSGPVPPGVAASPAHHGGHHAPAEPEFDTDVRQWLNLSETDLSPADPDVKPTRPVPTTPPATSRPPVGRPVPGAATDPGMRPVDPTPRPRSTPEPEPRHTPEPYESGELPPSTRRSAPYPADARRQAPPAAQATPPATSSATSAVSPPTGPVEPPPPARRTTGPISVDSEFFDAVGPGSRGSDASDPDAPLIDTTLGGSRPRPPVVDDDEEIADEVDHRPGDTGTDGPYRGRRARRSDS